MFTAVANDFGGLAKFFGFPVNRYDHRHVP